MSNFEWLVIGWLCVLTVWLFFFKQGPKGDKGGFDYYEHSLSEWDIRDPSIGLLDDSEYITKLIQKINSLQLSSGTNIVGD